MRRSEEEINRMLRALREDAREIAWGEGRQGWDTLTQEQRYRLQAADAASNTLQWVLGEDLVLTERRLEKTA